jgi:hypothetical protein
MDPRIAIPRDAAEVQVLVTGGNVLTPFRIVDVDKLKDSPVSLRLTDIIHSVQTGLTVYLWWEEEDGGSLIIPIEGRGRLDLSPMLGIQNPRNEGWTGHVTLTTSRAEGKSFFVGLEFAKVRV